MRKGAWVTILGLAMLIAGPIASAWSDASGAAGPESAQGPSDPQGRTMKIRLDVEGTTITATLHDNATSRDFVSLLPLTLSLTDYAATEKISNLPRELSTEGAPPGSDPSVGDITYYACVSACGPPLTGSVMSQSRSTFRRNGGLTRLGFRIG